MKERNMMNNVCGKIGFYGVMGIKVACFSVKTVSLLERSFPILNLQFIKNSTSQWLGEARKFPFYRKSSFLLENFLPTVKLQFYTKLPSHKQDVF